MSFNCFFFGVGFDVDCPPHTSYPCSFVDRHGELTTYRFRFLGVRDQFTKWPEVSWIEGSMKAMFRHLSSREIDTPSGRVTEERVRFYSNYPMRPGDQIVWFEQIYEIETEPVEHVLHGEAKYTHADAVKLRDVNAE